MNPQTLAHLSDLHLGHSADRDDAAIALCRALQLAKVDQVVVTGDITHDGRRTDWSRFEEIFQPLIRANRVTVVPGNHDRIGDDAAATEMMGGRRVDAVHRLGLYLVRVDSTAPHNRSSISSHGQIDDWLIDEVVDLLERAPRNATAVVLLHHHPVPLPEESVFERLSTWVGLPHAGELPLGYELLRRIRGKCDLILHGHRHVARSYRLWGRDDRPLDAFNAGSSTESRRVRILRHHEGALLGRPQWLGAAPDGAGLVADLETPFRPPRHALPSRSLRGRLSQAVSAAS